MSQQDPPRLRDDGSNAALARALRSAQRRRLLSPEGTLRVERASLAGSGRRQGAAAKPGLTLAGKIFGAASVKVGLAAIVVAGGVAWVWHDRTRQAVRDATPAAAVAAPAETAVTLATVSVPPSVVDSAAPLSTPPPVATAHPRAQKAASGLAPSASPGAREGALLLEARRVLDSNPARAIALVHAHEKEFPQSQLAPERARILAEAANRLNP